MNDSLVIEVVLIALFSLMAYRAFRSASALDYLLAFAQCLGLALLLLSDHRQLAAYLLLITALAYLLSQVVTGARIISRLLPLAGVVVVVLYLFVL